MKSILVTVATLLVMFTATARAADDTDALIALDKQWGESVVKGDTTVSAKLLADKVVSVTESGVKGSRYWSETGSWPSRMLSRMSAWK